MVTEGVVGGVIGVVIVRFGDAVVVGVGRVVVGVGVSSSSKDNHLG